MAGGNGVQRPGNDPPTRAQRPVSPERIKVMLDTLAATGNYAQACRTASPHSATGAYRTFKDLEKRSPEFADAVAEAMRTADGLLLEHARKLAMGQITRPKWYKDQIVGDEPVFDSRIMEVLLKGRFPSEFGDHLSIEHSGQVTHTLDAGVIQLSKRDLLALNEHQISHLKDIIAAIGRFRAESIDTEAIDESMRDITPVVPAIEQMDDPWNLEGFEEMEAVA